MRAHDLLEATGEVTPEVARLRAVSFQAEGDSFGWEDRYDLAKPAHQRAEGYIAALPAALSAATEARRARAANLRLLGEDQHKLGEADAARASLDRAGAVNRSLLAETLR